MEQEKFEIIRRNADAAAEILKKYRSAALPTPPEIVTTQYSRGGEVLHRGYYCPSLVYDIYIGGAGRGRLIKRYSTPPTWRYGFNKEGRLVVAENCGAKTRESILYDGETEVGLTVETEGPDAGKINRVSLTEYRDGKVFSYVCCDCFVDQKLASIYGEVYEYECGLLKQVYCCLNWLYNQRKPAPNEVLLTFGHDKDGYLTDYRYTDLHTSFSQIAPVTLKRRV